MVSQSHKRKEEGGMTQLVKYHLKDVACVVSMLSSFIYFSHLQPFGVVEFYVNTCTDNCYDVFRYTT